MKVEIDFIFNGGEWTLVNGWLIVDEILDERYLKVVDEMAFFRRQDVIDMFQCSSRSCTGFFAVLPSRNKFLDVIYKSSQVVLELSKQPKVDRLMSVDELPIEDYERIKNFLEKNGLYWGQESKDFSNNDERSTPIVYKDSRIQIDYAFILDAHTVLVIGWVLDQARLFKRINLRLNNIISDCILQDAFFHPRYDVAETLELPVHYGEKIGFAFTVSLPEPISPNIELMYSVDGTFFTGTALKAEAFRREETWLTEILLANVDITKTATFPKLTKHVTSAIEKSWQRRLQAPNAVDVKQFGNEVADPLLSLVIPIYGRYDFVQIQMSQFSLDSDFNNIEIVYVLDDPRIKHAFMVTCKGVYETFGVPFKVVLSERNLGYAGANNLGVSHALSEHIVLLNSDVIPKKPQQFLALLEQFKNEADVGILGGTLLYEDNTIQHQGMEYMQDPSHPGMWMNYHPQKGFPLSLTEQFEVKEAQAVTGALMLMTKQLYLDVGGFDIGYILGDFEDSDLCMKVRKKGKRIVVSGTVHMYHLERLSQSLVSDNTWKHTLSMVNGLRHTTKWNSEVQNVVAGNG